VKEVLSGCRVIDFGSFISGPFAAMLLGDLGAEVVKVERPGGDPFRNFEEGLYGPQFRAFNRNKQSIVLDLAKEGDRAAMHALVRESDVLVENSRPGVMTKLGIDHAALSEVNPRLVYCAITGFGRDGPDARQPAYDTVAQAASGYLSLFLSPGDTTIKGPATADVATALYAAYGILAALVERQSTGRGRLVEVAMMAAMAHFASEPFQHFFARGAAPAPAHRSHISQSFVFECRDDRMIAIHLSSPAKFWQGLVAAAGKSELLDDVRFSDRLSRIRNYDLLEAELRPVFARRTRTEWIKRLSDHDVPHSPINMLDEALASPNARQLNLERLSVHPVEGVVRTIASPIVYDGTAAPDPRPPPVLDEHGAAIREWLSASTRPKPPSAR
jgi:crotonobetainyl-CoA:carnitine CoA-transferase CaiB-like acyl-CoA transferase